mmetsp:Transcript_50046/g.100787  ORF Transcript_50046/g.100787 Transcript_50046/m.100787 type:complete len:216 (+) Transcript_50046:643-1290(+)
MLAVSAREPREMVESILFNLSVPCEAPCEPSSNFAESSFGPASMETEFPRFSEGAMPASVRFEVDFRLRCSCLHSSTSSFAFVRTASSWAALASWFTVLPIIVSLSTLVGNPPNALNASRASATAAPVDVLKSRTAFNRVTSAATDSCEPLLVFAGAAPGEPAAPPSAPPANGTAVAASAAAPGAPSGWAPASAAAVMAAPEGTCQLPPTQTNRA